MVRTTAPEFSARIGKAGINPYVDVPEEISRVFGRRANLPVKGTLNEVPIVATLVPLGGGRHRLYINTEMRKKARVKVGDDIHLRIELDTQPRVMGIPEQLRQALEDNKEAKLVWEKTPPSHQREILAYLNYLKTPAALERNVKKVIDTLSKRAKDGSAGI